jgi:hypothetical protein
MEIFDGADQHEAYESWLKTNPLGFVLHFNIGDQVLHKATCHHIGGRGNPPTNGTSWTSYHKVCTTDRALLKRLAALFPWSTFECQTCKP